MKYIFSDRALYQADADEARAEEIASNITKLDMGVITDIKVKEGEKPDES